MADRSHIARISSALRGWGATDIRLEFGGKHPKLRFTHDGKRQFYVVPGTPSERRSVHNCLADLKRILGVKRGHHAVKGKRRKTRHTPIPECPSLTAGESRLDVLTRHALMPRVRDYRLERAWEAMWRDCLRHVEGRP